MKTKTSMAIKLLVGLMALAGLARVIAAVKFDPGLQPIGYVGQPVASSSNVSDGNASMYSIDYSSKTWTGNMHSFSISNKGVIGATDAWTAGTGGIAGQIDLQSAADTRTIVTWNGSKGVPFRWASLTTGTGSQQAALDPVAAAAAGNSSTMLDFIRGSKANEGTAAGQFRVRASRLGDIIHSTPVYLTDGTNKTVFVGANDGMLHAINAVDGSERFAYIPSSLIPKLPKLANQTYLHQYFVDGRMDVKTFGTKTILVGALGAGGGGLYGLDVTSAVPTGADSTARETNAAAKVLWEITRDSAGFAELGDTYSTPALVKLPSGRSALVVGNGYNNTGNGHAVLYLIDALDGSLIKAIDTNVGDSTGKPNGLSSPSLWDSDHDGVKDTAYAGDIDGNLWKFNLTDFSFTKLYTNTDASPAITMAPVLGQFPTLGVGKGGGVMVAFVTGRMLNTADTTDTSDHYAYGVWDGAPSANDTMLVQTLTEKNFPVDASTNVRVRISDSNSPDWTPGIGHNKGWKTKLPIGGERVVGDGAFVTNVGMFQFFSTNPTISPTADLPGENWWMQIDMLTGGAADAPQFDLDGNFSFDSADQVDGQNPVGRFMGGGVRSQLIAMSANGVDVYQSNYDQNGAPKVTAGTPTTTTPPISDGSVTTGDRGVSGGHFDTDIFCFPGIYTTNCKTGTNRSGYGNEGVGNYLTLTDTSSGITKGMNIIHVHEYDDIYDVVGQDMLAPSQDAQRLSRVQFGTGPVATDNYAPDTPTLVSNELLAPSSVVTSTTTVARTETFKPSSSYNASYGATTVNSGYPKTTTTTTSTVVTTLSTYTTTVTKVVPSAYTSARSHGYTTYKWTDTVTINTWPTTLTHVVTTPILNFKVLVANQAYSPAVTLTIGDSPAAHSYNVLTTAGLTVGLLPTYTMVSIKALKSEMPIDAFNLKDWGTGIRRAGLHPTTPDCVGIGYTAGLAPAAGPLGEWRNGALTVQVVDASVTDSDIQLNVAGHPELGYRLTDASFRSKVVAEFAIYWHHPNHLCMGDTGWKPDPTQDATKPTATAGVKAAGSSDPTGFIFAAGTGGTYSGPTLTEGTVVTPVLNGDGTTTTTTVVTVKNSDGSYTVTTSHTITTPGTAGGEGSSTSGIGAIVTGGIVGGTCFKCGVPSLAAPLGRITWREVQP